MKSTPDDSSPSILPDVALLLSTSESNLGAFGALAELIDNALDAGSTEIQIRFGSNAASGLGKFLVVRDNGRGCSKLVDMLTTGRHMHRVTTKLGRYGVGLKDAALYFGGVDSKLRVDSVAEGLYRELTVHWRSLVQSPGRDVVTPGRIRAACQGRRGHTRAGVYPRLRGRADER